MTTKTLRRLGLCFGRTDHPFCTSIDPGIFPGAKRSNTQVSQRQWPDCEPFRLPASGRPSATDPSSGHLNVPQLTLSRSASACCGVLSCNLALPTSANGHKFSTRLPKGQPPDPSTLNPARTIAPHCHSSPIPLLQRHPFGGFGLRERQERKDNRGVTQPCQVNR